MSAAATRTEATFTFDATFAGRDTTAILKGCEAAGWVSSDDPAKVEIDHGKPTKKAKLWPSLAGAKEHLLADFADDAFVKVYVGQLVKVFRRRTHVAVPTLLEQLGALPFEVASFGPFHYQWADGSLGETYMPPAFGDWHVQLGWAAAFKGAGHDRLVSRRWLDDGPWKLWKGPNDVSLVQFHDLDADAATALAQARPAHARMGIGPSGGFLQKPFNYRHELSGLYDAAARTFKVVVLGRDLDDRELLEWAAARADARLAGGKPVDAVAFVFPAENEGLANHVRLSRYDFQTWVIRDGVEVRLDA